MLCLSNKWKLAVSGANGLNKYKYSAEDLVVRSNFNIRRTWLYPIEHLATINVRNHGIEQDILIP